METNLIYITLSPPKQTKMHKLTLVTDQVFLRPMWLLWPASDTNMLNYAELLMHRENSVNIFGIVI